jgi:hypothetical protein
MSKKTKKITKAVILDLSDFSQDSHGFLNQPTTEEGKGRVVKKVEESKIVKLKTSKDSEKKIGRPLISNEPLKSKLGCAVSESEYNKFKKKAGQIAVSVYLRDYLKKADLI